MCIRQLKENGEKFVYTTTERKWGKIVLKRYYIARLSNSELSVELLTIKRSK
jgi:hypothetical protein